MNGQLLSGRYEIIQVLGGDAFGKTFLAKDFQSPSHPTCVIKQLTYSSFDTQNLEVARRLFKQEAEILEKLGKHDKIPTLLAEFAENEEFYLVQQFIDGYPLNQEILPGQPWNEYQVIRLLTEILEILVFIHGQGVIHQDIKPNNLIRRSADHKLILIDFGGVKEIGTETSQGQLPSSVVVGAEQYIPIEQLQGHPKFNSDIYALGMIAIQALSGLDSGELSQLRNPHSPQKNQILWHNRVQVSPALSNVIDKMVHSDPNQRYQSASEVLIALGKVGTLSANPAPVISVVNPLHKPRWAMFAGVSALIVVGFVTYNFFNQEPPATALYHQGLEKAKKGDKEGAIADLTAAIKLTPKSGLIYYSRGLVYRDLSNKPKAIADFQQAKTLCSEQALKDCVTIAQSEIRKLSKSAIKNKAM